MKKIVCILLVVFIGYYTTAQFRLNYDTAAQPAGNIQYFKPKGNLFVGDCIPFFHNDTYYLYWLLDSGHHSALNGLGGHQWALSTSKDLVNWVHHPVVLGIDEEWEKSICTGSVVFYNNIFYAFYATRRIDTDGKVAEQLSYAASPDGIHFTKQLPNPFYTFAPGYSKRNFRDPKVVVDERGVFHLFVSSGQESETAIATGALVHLTSTDLKKWTVLQPLITGQDDVPECPDYFKWNNWYYLIYGRGGNTFYLKSKAPYGPWQYPASQALNEDWSNVVKTAAFINGRRIAAGWIPNRRGDKDNGHEIFGGNIVLREVLQDSDGTLLTKFPREMSVATSSPLQLNAVTDSFTSVVGKNNYVIHSPNGLGTAKFTGIPQNGSIALEVEPEGPVEEFGLYLRRTDRKSGGYKLGFSPATGEVHLHNTRISAVNGLNKKFRVEIIMTGDMIDVSVGGRRCIVNRLYEQRGEELVLFARHGRVRFSEIVITPLDIRQ